MNQTLKKYGVCLIFSFDLFVLVWLSEMLRPVVLAVSTGFTSGIPFLITYVSAIFFLFVFGIIPTILLAMWFISPIPIKKLLVQFGLNEKLFDRMGKKGKQNISHYEIRYAILALLYKKAENDSQHQSISQKGFYKILKIDPKLIEFDLLYLEEEKLIRTICNIDSPQNLEKIITSSGINVFERKEENKNRFPFLSAKIPIQFEAKIGIINL